MTTPYWVPRGIRKVPIEIFIDDLDTAKRHLVRHVQNLREILGDRELDTANPKLTLQVASRPSVAEGLRYNYLDLIGDPGPN